MPDGVPGAEWTRARVPPTPYAPPPVSHHPFLHAPIRRSRMRTSAPHAGRLMRARDTASGVSIGPLPSPEFRRCLGRGGRSAHQRLPSPPGAPGMPNRSPSCAGSRLVGQRPRRGCRSLGRGAGSLSPNTEPKRRFPSHERERTTRRASGPARPALISEEARQAPHAAKASYLAPCASIVQHETHLWRIFHRHDKRDRSEAAAVVNWRGYHPHRRPRILCFGAGGRRLEAVRIYLTNEAPRAFSSGGPFRSTAR